MWLGLDDWNPFHIQNWEVSTPEHYSTDAKNENPQNLLKLKLIFRHFSHTIKDLSGIPERLIPIDWPFCLTYVFDYI